jgi:hypothetical protein
MKALLAILVCVCLFAAGADAQEGQAPVSGETTLHGYIVDAMCAKGMAKHPETAMKKAANHTRVCAIEEECARSGYGVFADGKWYKFDGAGDKQALQLLRNTVKEKGIMVDATGTLTGETFAVTALTERSRDAQKVKSPAKKAERKKEG